MTVPTAVVIYDDRTSILPFTLTRPAIDLRCGVLRLWEKHGPVSSLIVAARRDHPASIATPAGVLAVVALGSVVLAETGRLPIDNPSTHLELTMIHEAMVLETSGRDLAWVDLASWLRLSVLLGLVGNLLLPWGVAGSAAPGPLLLGALALAGKLVLLAVLLATAEVAMAKLRLFRVPELLAGSFVLAFLAVTASYLVA